MHSAIVRIVFVWQESSINTQLEMIYIISIISISMLRSLPSDVPDSEGQLCKISLPASVVAWLRISEKSR